MTFGTNHLTRALEMAAGQVVYLSQHDEHLSTTASSSQPIRTRDDRPPFREPQARWRILWRRTQKLGAIEKELFIYHNVVTLNT